MTGSDLLLVDGLGVTFGGLAAVTNLSLRVGRGEIVSLIGPNGAGKTTVLNLLSGFVKPRSGSVVLGGAEIAGASPARIAAAGMRRTFQQNSLMFELSVGNNILAALHTRTRTGLFGALLQTATFRREADECQARIEIVLDAIGMRAQRDAIARTLPFGDQRKLGIGIAIATQPSILLLDEPAAGLNPGESAQLTTLMRQLRDTGVGIVLVEHDMRVVMGVSDRVAVLSRGEMLAEGTGPEIASNQEVLRAYLGDGSWMQADGNQADQGEKRA